MAQSRNRRAKKSSCNDFDDTVQCPVPQNPYTQEQLPGQIQTPVRTAIVFIGARSILPKVVVGFQMGLSGPGLLFGPAPDVGQPITDVGLEANQRRLRVNRTRTLYLVL